MKKPPYKSGRKDTGLTLVELLVAVSIMLIVMIAVYAFETNILMYTDQSQVQINNTWQAEAVLKPITKELRSMIPSATGAYPIAAVSSTSLTFFSNIDSDANIEQVRYFYSATNLNLSRGVVEPSGSPPSYNQSNETVSILANGVRMPTNSSVFEYYDNTYQGTSTPMVLPFSISNIRLIRIYLTIDTDPNRSPVVKTFTSSVSLRNLKSNI